MTAVMTLPYFSEREAQQKGHIRSWNWEKGWRN